MVSKRVKVRVAIVREFHIKKPPRISRAASVETIEKKELPFCGVVGATQSTHTERGAYFSI